MRLNRIAYISALTFASLAFAEPVINPRAQGKAWFVRQRSFAPGAPAGWTETPYRDEVGAVVINQTPPAIQSALRLVDVDQTGVFPVEPRLSVRGSVDQWADQSLQMDDELGEINRELKDIAAEASGTDAKIQNLESSRGPIGQRYEMLQENLRTVGLIVNLHPENKAARERFDDLSNKVSSVLKDLMRTQSEINSLTSSREERARAARVELETRATGLRDQLRALAGFYKSALSRAFRACASPWGFEAPTGVAVNPFYPGSSLRSPIGSARLRVCVYDGRVHATYLLDASERIVATALYGWDKEGHVNRVRILDAKKNLLEDHQYLPGPNQKIRYGLTFRNTKGSLTSIYMDI